MRKISAFISLTAVITLNAIAGDDKQSCDQLLTETRAREIIASERSKRDDLGQEPDNYEVVFRHDGCESVYIEWKLPKRPGGNRVFRFDSKGNIILFMFGH